MCKYYYVNLRYVQLIFLDVCTDFILTALTLISPDFLPCSRLGLGARFSIFGLVSEGGLAGGPADPRPPLIIGDRNLGLLNMWLWGCSGSASGKGGGGGALVASDFGGLAGGRFSWKQSYTTDNEQCQESKWRLTRQILAIIIL